MVDDALRVRVPDDATCRKCGYALRELSSDVCPECGLGFSAEDASSYRRPNQRRWLAWAQPPGRVHAGVYIALAVATIWDGSVPHAALWRWFGGYGLISAVILVGLIAGYVVRVMLWGMAPWVSEPSPVKPGRSSRYWLIAPAAVAVISSVWVTDWPLRLRVQLSRSALDAALGEYRASAQETTEEQRIGLYYVRAVRVDDDGSILFETGRFRDFKGRMHHVGFMAPVDALKSRRERLFDDDPNGWCIGSIRVRRVRPQVQP